MMPASDKKKATVIIPARFESTRFPGKPLAEIDGKPLIYYSYRAVSKSTRVGEVIVATDDRRIEEAVRAFGGKVVLTSSAPRTGTDRIAEAVEHLPGEWFVNVQGDEILLQDGFLDPLIERFVRDPALQMGTYKREISGWDEVLNPNVVKVVTDCNDDALYFSRAPIPYLRDRAEGEPLPPRSYFRHFGIYLYRRELLKQYANWPESPLERIEKLEQLRVLERGIRIRVMETASDSLRVDVPGDLDPIRNLLKESHG